MEKPNLQIMRAAIEIAEANQTPFGAALAMGDELFVTAANQTKTLNDPTTHAEVVGIRKLGEMTGKTTFSGFTLYTTCVPCHVCMSAINKAEIDSLFFGCDSHTITNYMEQNNLRAITINQQSFHAVKVKGNVLKNECKELLEAFSG